MDDILKEAKMHMDQALKVLREDLSTIRAGRANASLIDYLKIKAYGGTTELKLSELATITTSDAKTIIVSPFDQSVIDEIERGIKQSNLGLSVSQDGQIVRVSVPQLTEDRRDEFIKLAKTKTEGVRVMIRQSRQEAMNTIRDQFQEKEIDEDAKDHTEKEVQKLTDDKIEEADKLLNSKIQELTTI